MSPRLAEVWRLMAQGMSDQAIAEALYLSPSTVSNALTKIYEEVCGPPSAGVNRRVRAAVLFHARADAGERAQDARAA